MIDFGLLKHQLEIARRKGPFNLEEFAARALGIKRSDYATTGEFEDAVIHSLQAQENHMKLFIDPEYARARWGGLNAGFLKTQSMLRKAWLSDRELDNWLIANTPC